MAEKGKKRKGVETKGVSDMKEKREKAKKRLAEMHRRLDRIEGKVEKIELPVRREDLKGVVDRVVDILDRMVKGDVNEYREVGHKKRGDVEVAHALRIKFLDEEKPKKRKR